MSTISIRIPDSLHRRLKSAAEQDGVSINQFVSHAVAEKLSVMQTYNLISERAAKGSRESFLKAMSKVPAGDVVEGNEMHPAAKRKKKPTILTPIFNPRTIQQSINNVNYDDIINSYLTRSQKHTRLTDIILEQAVLHQEAGRSSAERVFAAALHVNMLSHDVMALLLMHCITEDKWTNRTAARMIATVIYEGVDDLQTIFGKPFREACITLGIFDAIKTDLAKVRKETTTFQMNHNLVLKSIRMSAGAHRDHDLVGFLGAFIDESTTSAVLAAAVNLEKCLQKWGLFCTDAIKRATEAVNKTTSET